MAAKTWSTPNWPEGVSHDVSDYAKPLFSVLDESARAYPNLVYTIFNDATRTYAQVKDTADRVANFLASRGIQKGDRVAIFLPTCPIIRPYFSASSKPVPCASPATPCTPPTNSITS